LSTNAQNYSKQINKNASKIIVLVCTTTFENYDSWHVADHDSLIKSRLLSKSLLGLAK